MKKYLLFSASIILLLSISYSCTEEDDNPTTPNPSPDIYEVQELFSDTSWANEEMSAMSYDPVGDNLYYVRSTNSSPNQLRRYSFTTGMIDTAYSYTSQWDYGMRIFNGELYIVRSYDYSILRLTGLSGGTLTKVNIYPDSINQNQAMREIIDITLVNNNLYFIHGNMLTSLHHNGIQYLQGPGFTTINEFLSPAEANWPDSSYGYVRSIISLGSGSSAKFVIATGSGGNIELRDASGDLVKADSGYGDAYLQKDSQDRIYALTGFNNNTILTRWSDSLANKTEFKLNFTQYNGGNGIRFILRETGNNIEVIMIKYRSREPVFYKTTIPD